MSKEPLTPAAFNGDPLADAIRWHGF